MWRVVLGLFGVLICFGGALLWIGYLVLWLRATRRGLVAELYKAAVLALVPSVVLTLVVLIVFDLDELGLARAEVVPGLRAEWALWATACGVICLLALAWQGRGR